jgi:hypothetical protein
MLGRKRKGRKLLVATLGVAAVSYVGCGDDDRNPTVANLVGPPLDSGADAKDASDAKDARDADVKDVGFPRDVVANLVAPDLGVE